MEVPWVDDVDLAPFNAVECLRRRGALGPERLHVPAMLPFDHASHLVRDTVMNTLDHIDAVDGQFGAFIAVLHERALARAEALDAGSRAGTVGVLHGVTIAVKDCIDVAGVPTSCGTREAGRQLPLVSASSVAALEDAGAVVVGKTNLHEWAYGATSDNPWFGRVRHPIDTSRSPGGSSGGSAVAVAAGMARLALGTDTGGSVRIPASYCGIAGLKATPGRISVSGVEPLSWTLDTVGLLARNVDDLAVAYAVTSGAEIVLEESSHPPRPFHLGVLATGPYATGKSDPYVADSVATAVQRLVLAGAVMHHPLIPELEAVRSAFFPIVLAEAAVVHGGGRIAGRPKYGRDIQQALTDGDRILATEYIAALRWRSKLTAAFERGFDGLDALVAPVVPQVAPEHQAGEVRWPDGTSEPALEAAARHCLPASLAGLPALALPIPGLRGLPVGLQVIGRPGSDAQLLRLGRWIEATLARA